MSNTLNVSSSARRRLLSMFAVGIAGLLGTTWFVLSPMLSVGPDGEVPGTYDIAGLHPGDITPGQYFTDNARNYGIDADLPYTFRSNSLGFRGPQPLSGGRPLVIILGDSFAFGMGVNEGDTFPDTLRETLQNRGYESIVVHNAALPGYTIADQLEQWRDKLAALKPDLVLLCHTASDLKEMARPTSFRRLMRWDDEDPSLQDTDIERLVEEAGGRSELIRSSYTFTQDVLIQRLGAQAPVELKKLQREYNGMVVSLRDQIQASGASFGLILWVSGYGMAGLTTSALKDVAQRKNILFFDGDRAMQSQGQVPVSSLFLPDKHFSSAGNAVAGRQTANWLIGQGLLK